MPTKLQRFEETEAYLKEKMRFYISSPERFAEAFVFSYLLEKFAKRIKESVKERGREVMEKFEGREIVVENFKVQEIGATRSAEYSAQSVMAGLIELHEGNIADAWAAAKVFFKVSTGPFEKWLKMNKFEGPILTKFADGKKFKERAGYFKVSEIKKGGEK